MMRDRSELFNESNEEKIELENYQKKILEMIRAGSLNDLIMFVEMGHYSLKDQINPGTFLPVHAAAWYGHFNVIKWLINEKHCQSNQAEFFPESDWMIDLTPLCLAMVSGHVNMVKRIITETNYNFDQKNRIALTKIALEDGNLDFLKWLVAANYIKLKDERITNKNKTQHPLFIAISKNYFSLVKWLVEEQHFQLIIDPYKPVGYFLCWVLSFGYIEIAQWLINDKGLLLNDHYFIKKITLNAIKKNHLHVLKWLLQNNFKLPSRSLLYAIKKSQYEISKWLVAQGFSLTRTDEFNKNVLSIALSNGSLEIVKWLINEHGFGLDVASENNDSSLLLACRNGSLELVKWLVEEKNCLLTVEDTGGRGVIIMAIISGDLELIKYLVDEKGCTLDVKSKSNGTHPIHYAAYHNHVDILKWLVEVKKCNLEAITDKGDSILSCNITYWNFELHNWLIKEKSVCANKNIRNSLFAIIDSCIQHSRPMIYRIIDQLILNAENWGELEKWLDVLDRKLTKNNIDWMIVDRNKIYNYVIEKFKDINIQFHQMVLDHYCHINQHSLEHIEILLQENNLDKAIKSIYTLINNKKVDMKVQEEAKITLAEVLFQGIVDIDEEDSPLNVNDEFLLEENNIKKRALQAYYLLQDINTLESKRIKERLNNILSGNNKIIFMDHLHISWLPEAKPYYNQYVIYKIGTDMQIINNVCEATLSKKQPKTKFYATYNCGQLFKSSREIEVTEKNSHHSEKNSKLSKSL